MKNKKKYIMLVLVSSFFIYVTAFASEIKNAENDKSNLEKKKQQITQNLQELENEKGNIVNYIEKLDKQYASLETQIQQSEKKIVNTKSDLSNIRKELQAAKEAESNQYEKMKKCIKYMYENGSTDYLEVIIEAENMADMLNRAEYIIKISEYDENLFESYQEIKRLTKEKRLELEKNLKKLKELKEELNFEKDTINQLINNKNIELKKYNSEIGVSKEVIQKYNQEIKEQEKFIEDLLEQERQRIEIQKREEKKKKQQEQERQKQEQRQEQEQQEQQVQEQPEKNLEEESVNQDNLDTQENNNSKEENDQDTTENDNNIAEENKSISEDNEENTIGEETINSTTPQESEDSNESSDHNFNGAFRWPLNTSGTITSNFGERNSPTEGASSYHQGIDISVPSGTSIVAAASGEVVTASYSAASGNYIMLYHGDSTYTVYMHASKLNVSVGQTVEAGQVIAFAGSTGISTGSHLHFAISKNGQYVNPLTYVSN